MLYIQERAFWILFTVNRVLIPLTYSISLKSIILLCHSEIAKFHRIQAFKNQKFIMMC